MTMDEMTDFERDTSTARWRIEGWGLVRGLVLLFSAFVGVSVLYAIIAAVFRG